MSANPQKVVVADDDPTIRSTLAEALRDWGYETHEATTLAETLADRKSTRLNSSH